MQFITLSSIKLNVNNTPKQVSLGQSLFKRARDQV